MSARDEIFASIRRSLNVGPVDAPRRDAVAARLAHAPVGIVPRRGHGEAVPVSLSMSSVWVTSAAQRRWASRFWMRSWR